MKLYKAIMHLIIGFAMFFVAAFTDNSITMWLSIIVCFPALWAGTQNLLDWEEERYQ